MSHPKTELVVALDFNSTTTAERLMSDLKGLPVIYKIGLQMFTSIGPAWVKVITGAGHRVFLDLKLHDIPNTVAKTVQVISHMGVEFTSVHMIGGRKMLDEIVAQTPPSSKIKVLGISVLTSFAEEDWIATNSMVSKLGAVRTVADSAMHFANLASEHKAVNGMVCSAHEVKTIREKHPNLYLMVPGIRPEGFEHNDQSRVMTPKQAAEAKASAIVVGRPILKADNPREVAEKILSDLT